jgi:hypothetical protein
MLHSAGVSMRLRPPPQVREGVSYVSVTTHKWRFSNLKNNNKKDKKKARKTTIFIVESYIYLHF